MIAFMGPFAHWFFVSRDIMWVAIAMFPLWLAGLSQIFARTENQGIRELGAFLLLCSVVFQIAGIAAVYFGVIR